MLGAQNAALAALKPGMTLGGKDASSLQKIAMDYIDSHGKDLEGHSLGRYYIHGLSHHVGLDVHDPSGPNYGTQPLQPGMVITVEPGIYIPEENLGVRIEDDVLITPTGYKHAHRAPAALARRNRKDHGRRESGTRKSSAVDRASPKRFMSLGFSGRGKNVPFCHSERRISLRSKYIKRNKERFFASLRMTAF